MLSKIMPKATRRRQKPAILPADWQAEVIDCPQPVLLITNQRRSGCGASIIRQRGCPDETIFGFNPATDSFIVVGERGAVLHARADLLEIILLSGSVITLRLR